MLEEQTEVSEKTPIWYPTMSHEEREALLANYKPEDHLTSWEKGGEALIYYPSAWRLYELRLRFPEVMLDTDIYHFNENTGLVILVTKLYVGASYEQSRLRAKAFKQGNVGKLDALQTMCEARAARNFGISPTLALDVDDTDIAKIAIRSEQEHQAKRNAASSKRVNQAKQEAQTPLYQKVASMRRIAETLKIEMPATITLEVADAFIKQHRAAYQQAKATQDEQKSQSPTPTAEPSTQPTQEEPKSAPAPVPTVETSAPEASVRQADEPDPAPAQPTKLTVVVPSMQQIVDLADKRFRGGYGALHTLLVKQGLPQDQFKWTEEQRLQAWEVLKQNMPAPPSPAKEEQASTGEPATEAQIASIRRLYERLGKEAPSLPSTYVAAKELLAQLSQEYKQSRARAS